MKATAKWLTVLALTVAASGQVWAESGKREVVAPAVSLTGWERVGDAGATAQSVVSPARGLAPGEGGLKERKADMVRRMFWIMMAHR